MTIVRLVNMFSKYSCSFSYSLSPFLSLFVFLKRNISEIYDFSARYLDEISYRCGLFLCPTGCSGIGNNPHRRSALYSRPMMY